MTVNKEQTYHSESLSEHALQLTAIQEDYLAIIYLEQKENGLARGCDIALEADVTRGTVATTLRSLKALGLVSYEPYGPIRLSAEGFAIGEKTAKRRAILFCFFKDVMKLEEKKAQQLAHELEHAVDSDTLNRFSQLTTFFAQHANALTFT